MSHIYSLDHFGMPMPSFPLPTQEAGYRIVWEGEEIPFQGATQWYESIRRWLPIQGGFVQTAQPLHYLLKARIIRVPTGPQTHEEATSNPTGTLSLPQDPG